jgi:hypothetical protein
MLQQKGRKSLLKTPVPILTQLFGVCSTNDIERWQYTVLRSLSCLGQVFSTLTVSPFFAV